MAPAVAVNGRQLLAVSDALMEDVLIPHDHILLMVLSFFMVCALLIFVIALCACVKSKNSQYPLDNYRSSNKDGVHLKQVTPKPDRRSGASVDSVVISQTDVSPVQENGNARTSDGSAVDVQIDPDNKLSTAERRALPQIPLVPQTTPPDEDEDDGNYDVIPNRMVQNSRSRISQPTNVSTFQNNGNASNFEDNTSELYSEVTDPGVSPTKSRKDAKSDPPYAGIRSSKSEPPYADVGSSKSEPPYSKVKSPTAPQSPYVQVDNIGDPSYAQVSDKASPPKQLALGTAAAPEENYSSVAPPVPDKQFSGDEVDSLPTGNHTVDVAQHSPDLPPRNSFGPDSAVGETSSGAVLNLPVAEGGLPPPGNDASPGKRKEPPYSSVTARESIVRVRERQQAELALQAQDSDAFYESVNYEQINTMRTDHDIGTSIAVAGQRNSLSSDLYAEINNDSGNNSTRSSMYARVNDIQRNDHAPTPPPVESLKHLSHHNEDDGDENAVDPGYSKIKRATIHQTNMADSESDADISQMYAQVDKSHRRSRSDGAHTAANQDFGQLYAQVDKSGKKARSPQQQNQFTTPKQYEGTGARPKIRTNARVFSPRQSVQKSSNLSNVDIEDPNYDVIGDVDMNNSDPGYAKVKDQNGSYAAVKETNIKTSSTPDNVSDYDPNYEQVNLNELAEIREKENTSNTSILNNSLQQPMVHIGAHQVDDDFWLKTEPLYQEIDNSSQEQTKHKKDRKMPNTSL